MPISVLYIHHCGIFSGASRSLLEMIKAFPEGAIHPYIVTPSGNAADFFEDAGAQVLRTRGISIFDHSRITHYRGLRWLILLREIYFSFFTIWAILKARIQWSNIDIVHVNEYAAILPVFLAKLVYNKPLVLHARSLQETKIGKWRRYSINHLVKHYTDAVIAIDENVRTTLPEWLNVRTIHNGTFYSYNNNEEGRQNYLKEKLGIKPHETVVGMVGNLLPYKGVYEFIELARICKERGLPIHFVLVGDNTRKLTGLTGWLLKKLRFATDVKADIKRLAKEYAIENNVHLMGFITDVDWIYKNIDILCFPSHLEGVGRPVFEAAFCKVTSIVAISNPINDTIIDGETGICVPPYNPQALADAIERLHRNPEKRKRMGHSAYELAVQQFDIRKNAGHMLEVYRQLVSTCSDTSLSHRLGLKP